MKTKKGEMSNSIVKDNSKGTKKQLKVITDEGKLIKSNSSANLSRPDVMNSTMNTSRIGKHQAFHAPVETIHEK